jgi:uroporphyrinogen-III synthase
MKYFCITEQTANYLHKYIVIRKRKIFTGTKTALDLLEVIKKHKTEKFMFPCSNKRQKDLPDYMGTNDFQFTEAVMY